MANRSKRKGGAARSNVIIDIRGGRNQIFPNVTTMVQNFYGAEFAPGNKRNRSTPKEETEESDAWHVARKTLRLYYPVKSELDEIIRRISDCRNTSDLANLMVNEIHHREALTLALVVKEPFIEALRQFQTFDSGSTVGNIRKQINHAARR